MHRALRWSYNWTRYLDYNWKVIILGMFKRQSLQQQLAHDSIFDLKSKRKPRFLPPHYYAHIILFKIVHSADRWSNLNYSFLRTHILEISGTSKCCNALKLRGVCGRIDSAAPWILSWRRERLHTLSCCILLTGNLRYFATTGAKLATLRHCVREARSCYCNCFVWLGEFSFPWKSMERSSLAASYLFTHQSLS